ncbi:MAG: hypothetical protein LBJ36_11265 [Synergistaceae bacterium]|nr:hypothetical protein [Synergistaceae bacterium]
MITQDLKNYFSRHFLGKVKVNRLSPALTFPQVYALKRRVETHPIRTQMRVTGAGLLTLGNIACSSRGFRFPNQWVKAKGSAIAKYVPEKMRVRAMPKLQMKVKTRDGTKRAAVLPQERSNRLQWQTMKPKKEGEMLLAWYGPIIEEAIVKMTLNKQYGTLLIWYNPTSRHFESRGIYLYRRLGVHSDFEWRWM